jgi:transposase
MLHRRGNLLIGQLINAIRGNDDRSKSIQDRTRVRRLRYLRRLLVINAISIVGTARTRPDKYLWVIELLGRRPIKVVAVALANNMARIAGAVLARGETYRAPARMAPRPASSWN